MPSLLLFRGRDYILNIGDDGMGTINIIGLIQFLLAVGAVVALFKLAGRVKRLRSVLSEVEFAKAKALHKVEELECKHVRLVSDLERSVKDGDKVIYSHIKSIEILKERNGELQDDALIYHRRAEEAEAEAVEAEDGREAAVKTATEYTEASKRVIAKLGTRVFKDHTGAMLTSTSEWSRFKRMASEKDISSA